MISVWSGNLAIVYLYSGRKAYRSDLFHMMKTDTYAMGMELGPGMRLKIHK
jgi:hypothetical protein